MYILTLSRATIFALIAVAILLLKSDQIHNPSLSGIAQDSFVPSARDKKGIDRTARAHIEQAYGKLPMRFEANQGQTNARVKFLARGAGYSVFLTDDEAAVQLHRQESSRGETSEQQMVDTPVESATLRMKLAGSNPSSRVSGIDKLSSSTNYFIGNNPAAWRSRVSNYSKVKYESVYPGIDLVWYGNQRLLEHDFLVAPGADPGRIKLSFSGMDKMSIDGEGALVLRAGGEDLRMLKPHAWQESDSGRRAISCDYSLSEKDQVEFRLGDYDTTLPLVIDPVLVYSTYIGGVGTDAGVDIVVDGVGAAYICGRTDSADFPGPSPIQQAKGAQFDAYVLKINPAGDAIVFGAWIGGNGSEQAVAVSVDTGGNVYLAGSTTSLDFPLQNPLQASRNGVQDAFVAKIDSSGSALLYSTYIGGAGADGASDAKVGGAGNLHLTGTTDSIDFPVMNAFQPAKNGSGAYASDNGGASWSEIKNGLTVTATNDLAISPGDSSTIFAGTDRGVFKTTDRGASWNLLGGSQFIRSINQILVSPATPDILYAVSSNQLFKSVDGGETWTLKQISLVRTVAIDPITPSILYAGATGGFLISADGGDSWTPIAIPPILGGTIGPVDAIAIDPSTPATVYIGTGQGIYKSVNGGTIWTFAGAGLPIFTPPVRIIRIAISRSNPATIYALTDNGRIFKTGDGAASWTQLNAAPAVGATVVSQAPLPLVVAPDNSEMVYVGSRSLGLFRSDDGGISWNTINNGQHGREIRAIAFDPNSPARIYAGAYTSTDIFIAKLNETGSSFIYSSYIGGGATDNGGAIAIDATGAAYIAGLTNSPNFPVVNAFQGATLGLPDAFAARIDASGSAVSWATYLGGSNFDNATAIAVRATGEVVVAGVTASGDFPVNNAIQPVLKGAQDGFISSLKNDGSALDFSTYLGGAGADSIAAVAVDSAGNAYLTGATNSLDFPVISATQPVRGGNPAVGVPDAFVTKINAGGNAIIYSTYLGGSGTDQGLGIAVDAAANAYVTGAVSSSDFPTTPFPIRPAGVADAFVTKLGSSADLMITLKGAPNPVMVRRVLKYSLVVNNNGPDPAIGVKVTDVLPTGVSLVSAAPSQGDCSCSSNINCELGDIAAGGGAEIIITAIPSRVGTITNQASVTSGTLDVNPTNNTATIETTVSSLPSIYGRVTADGVGLSGVTVAVDGSGRPPVVTAGDGNYQMSELKRRMDYTVTPSRQGHVFNPPKRRINNLQGDRRVDFAAVACNLSISPTVQSFPAPGGNGSVIITSPDSQCAWTATSNAPWITFVSATMGNGSKIVRFEVAPSAVSRSGIIKINDTTITVFQEFNACDTATFNTPNIFSITGLRSDSQPANLVAEDFNNDSVSDLVFNVTQPAPGLSVALSNSAGGYDEARMVYSGGAQAIRAGDLNNDGIKDLALITNDSPSGLIILPGNGAGGFSAPVNINTGPAPTALAIADINNDGISDLVVGGGSLLPPDPSQANYNLAIYPGNGSGGFDAPRNFGFTTASGAFPLQIESGDFNGDGKRDIAVLARPGPVIFTQGDLDDFTISTVNIITQARVMALGDFNGDLKTDLAVSRLDPSGGATISILISTTAGVFQTALPINILFDELCFATDLNGDGKSDLLVRGINDIRAYYATGEGAFSVPVRFITGGTPGSPTLGDFKRDGQNLRADIFAIVPPNFSIFSPTVQVSILTSDATGGFDAPRAFSYDPPNQFSQSVSFDIESGDLNGDGAMDLVIAPSRFQGIVIMYGDGRGAFGAPVLISAGIGAFASNIELADINNDGKTDLAVLNANTINVVILLGDGQGGFTQSATINTGIASSSLEPADFNNDGNIDMVVKAESGGLALFLGDGQGGFTQSISGIGGNLFSVTFKSGDFNGDGNADLAFTDDQQFSDRKIVILPGNGQGGFGAPINVPVSGFGLLFFADDLNHDGIDDLVYGPGAVAESIVVVLGRPGGSFAAPVQYPAGPSLRMAASDDVNGDGKMDLITVSNVAGSVSILLGAGDGSFEAPMNFRFITSPSTLTTGDFDADGRMDIAVAGFGDSTVGILRNRSCVP